MRASVLASLATLLASLLPDAAPGSPRLGALELNAGRTGTELALELPSGATHRLFTLAHPDRVVLDLGGVSLGRGAVAPAPVGIVKALRIAPHSAATLRIVMEVTSPVTPRASSAPLGAARTRLTVLLPGTPAGATPVPVRELADSPARLIIVAVDAGHGGDDPGAIGRHGTREKDVTLAVARSLAARIDAEPGMRAVLTRNSDQFVELRDRIERARLAHADLFVSVHADAVADRSVSGASVYVLSTRGASSEQAKILAEHENAADLVGGVSQIKDPVLRSVVLDVGQSAAMSASRLAARRVLASLDGIGDVHHSEVQQAGFVVLKSPQIPSMLIETAYITNADEERQLKNPAHQGRLAEAILAGIRGYFNDHPPPGTRLTARAESAAEPEAQLR